MENLKTGSRGYPEGRWGFGLTIARTDGQKQMDFRVKRSQKKKWKLKKKEKGKDLERKKSRAKSGGSAPWKNSNAERSLGSRKERRKKGKKKLT